MVLRSRGAGEGKGETDFVAFVPEPSINDIYIDSRFPRLATLMQRSNQLKETEPEKNVISLS
jgi:hypothetical protein